jgi:hypothetical protein
LKKIKKTPVTHEQINKYRMPKVIRASNSGKAKIQADIFLTTNPTLLQIAVANLENEI